MLNRIIFGIILIISAFVLQWWLSFILAILGLLYFDNLYEAIIVGIIIDSLYGNGIELELLQGFNFLFTLILVILFVLINSFKSNLLIRK